jgi:hypothetical protein
MLSMNNNLHAVYFSTMGAFSPVCLGILSMLDFVIIYYQCGTHDNVCNGYVYQTFYWCNILYVIYAMFLMLGLLMSLHSSQFVFLLEFPWIIHHIG